MDADGPDVVSSVTAGTRVNLVVTVERSWWFTSDEADADRAALESGSDPRAT